MMIELEERSEVFSGTEMNETNEEALSIEMWQVNELSTWMELI